MRNHIRGRKFHNNRPEISRESLGNIFYDDFAYFIRCGASLARSTSQKMIGNSKNLLQIMMDRCGIDMIAEIAKYLPLPALFALRRANRVIKWALESRSVDLWKAAFRELGIAEGWDPDFRFGVLMEHRLPAELRKRRRRGKNRARMRGTDIWLAFARLYRRELVEILKYHKNKIDQVFGLRGQWMQFYRSETSGKWLGVQTDLKKYAWEYGRIIHAGINIKYKGIQENSKELDNAKIKLFINDVLVTEQNIAGYHHRVSSQGGKYIQVSLQDLESESLPNAIFDNNKVELEFEGLNLPLEAIVELDIRYGETLKRVAKCLFSSWLTPKCIVIYNNFWPRTKFIAVTKNLLDIHDDLIEHIRRVTAGKRIYE